MLLSATAITVYKQLLPWSAVVQHFCWGVKLIQIYLFDRKLLPYGFFIVLIFTSIYGKSNSISLNEINYCRSCLSLKNDDCIKWLSEDTNKRILFSSFEQRELNYKYMGYFLKPFIGVSILSIVSLVGLTASTEGANDREYDGLLKGLKLTGAIELSNISLFIGGLIFFKKRNNAIDQNLLNFYQNQQNK